MLHCPATIYHTSPGCNNCVRAVKGEDACLLDPDKFFCSHCVYDLLQKPASVLLNDDISIYEAKTQRFCKNYPKCAFSRTWQTNKDNIVHVIIRH